MSSRRWSRERSTDVSRSSTDTGAMPRELRPTPSDGPWLSRSTGWAFARAPTLTPDPEQHMRTRESPHRFPTFHCREKPRTGALGAGTTTCLRCIVQLLRVTGQPAVAQSLSPPPSVGPGSPETYRQRGRPTGACSRASSMACAVRPPVPRRSDGFSGPGSSPAWRPRPSR